MQSTPIIFSREYYLDYLRVFATFAVMFLHVATSNFFSADVHSFDWNIFNFYNSIVRWGVPVFVMISGALFLSKDIPFKKIYSKYIFRIVTAFLFWSFVYAVMRYIKTRDIIKTSAIFIRGYYHLWFLFMISCLYMLLPFTKKISESKFLTKYFLILAFIFAILFPQSINLISLFSEKYGTFARKTFGQFHMYFIAGFTGYFLLGYVLNKIEISSKAEHAIYFTGIFGFFMTIFFTAMLSLIKNEPIEIFYGNMTINVLFESIAVFVFFKKHFSKSSKLILMLSKYSFGAYLVHYGIRSLFILLGLNTLSFNPVFSVPVISVLVFIISFAISGILNNVPVLKKYIV